MTLRQKLITVCISLGIGLLLSFAMGEIFLRLHAPKMSRLQNNQIILPKNQIYIYDNTQLRGADARIIHHKNSLGFRGAEPPVDFDRALTIVAVGGSTTECFYLSDGHSWPEIVGRLLKKDIPNVWVNNAGLDGHSTFGHTVLVRDYLSKLHPKIALFLVGINDVGRADLGAYDQTLIKTSGGAKSLLVTIGEKSRVIALLENLLRAYGAWSRGLGHRTLAIEKLPRLAVSEKIAQNALHHHETEFLPAYKERLRGLIETCRDAQIKPVLITQPALYGKGHDDATGIDLEAIEVHKDENGRLAWQILELYNDVTRAVAREAHVPLIDLARELPKSSQYFYDFYHFTNTGSAATADIVAKDLRPFLPH